MKFKFDRFLIMVTQLVRHARRKTNDPKIGSLFHCDTLYQAKHRVIVDVWSSFLHRAEC